jgi:hypothetical protein
MCISEKIELLQEALNKNKCSPETLSRLLGFNAAPEDFHKCSENSVQLMKGDIDPTSLSDFVSETVTSPQSDKY